MIGLETVDIESIVIPWEHPGALLVALVYYVLALAYVDSKGEF